MKALCTSAYFGALYGKGLGVTKSNSESVLQAEKTSTHTQKESTQVSLVMPGSFLNHHRLWNWHPFRRRLLKTPLELNRLQGEWS